MGQLPFYSAKYGLKSQRHFVKYGTFRERTLVKIPRSTRHRQLWEVGVAARHEAYYSSFSHALSHCFLHAAASPARTSRARARSAASGGSTTSCPMYEVMTEVERTSIRSLGHAKNAVCMQCTCSAHAVHCSAHAHTARMHMRCPCGAHAHAVLMRCTCTCTCTCCSVHAPWA